MNSLSKGLNCLGSLGFSSPNPKQGFFLCEPNDLYLLGRKTKETALTGSCSCGEQPCPDGPKDSSCPGSRSDVTRNNLRQTGPHGVQDGQATADEPTKGCPWDAEPMTRGEGDQSYPGRLLQVGRGGCKVPDQLDFPTINERYRGRAYCHVWGWTSSNYSRIALVKKNLCTGPTPLPIFRY